MTAPFDADKTTAEVVEQMLWASDATRDGSDVEGIGRYVAAALRRAYEAGRAEVEPLRSIVADLADDEMGARHVERRFCALCQEPGGDEEEFHAESCVWRRARRACARGGAKGE